MDIREACSKLENLRDDIQNRNKSFDQNLDSVSSFFYSDFSDILIAVDEAVDKIDSLEEERDELQKRLDELEGQ